MPTSPKHPCLSCTLPDCDDRSPRCELRRAVALYSRTRKHGGVVTDDLRAAATTAHYELWQLEARARRSEVRK